MIVAEPDLESVAIDPGEADSPLIVDPDRPLARRITFQLLQPVARRSAKHIQIEGRVKLLKAPLGEAPQLWRDAADGLTEKKTCRAPVGEPSDHTPGVGVGTWYVKRTALIWGEA
jgi:hypothetical protein